MRYQVLACDYDGTLATDGIVDARTLEALEKLLASGRKLVMVTGREIEDLLANFEYAHLFAHIVAENGALLYRPGDKSARALCDLPPDHFVEMLRARGVGPISVGHVIVATWRPHETAVLEVIQKLGLDLQVIFNKDAVMVLPSGVNKATGLMESLKELGYSAHEVVGVGDAENDHAFLKLCECSAAVANALPAVKDTADLVLEHPRGDGVAELIEALVAHDLAEFEDRLTRHHILLGESASGEQVKFNAFGKSILIAGPSGSGKSTVATSFLEQINTHRSQFCVIDPEGDFETLEIATTLGGSHGGPSPNEVLASLAKSPESSVIVNLIGVAVSDRPMFFLTLLPRLLEMRARTGRPHWIIMDEAHHLFPAAWVPGPEVLASELTRCVFITVHPDQLAREVLSVVDSLIAIGDRPEEPIAQFYVGLGEPTPPLQLTPWEDGQVTLWSRARKQGLLFKPKRSTLERRRHTRKYAAGEMSPETSFYFRGPEGKLNLRAQNLMLFMQVADGVDDATWEFHLREGDYSDWFRSCIKDETLAAEAAAIEARRGLAADQSRAEIRKLIEKYYTLPASSPTPIPGTAAEKVT